MKLPDTNVLIYAVNISSRQHRVAIEWLKAAFSEPAGVGLAWVALLGFLRITTRAGILSKPLSLEEALGVLKFWLAQPRARVLHPGEHHVDVIGRLLAAIGTAGNLASDAHLAALSIEHGAILGTFDRDFLRFDDVKVELLRTPASGS